MSKKIPNGIAREHLLAAIRDIDLGVSHGFGEPTGLANLRAQAKLEFIHALHGKARVYNQGE